MNNNDKYKNMSPEEKNERLERARNSSVKPRNPDMIDVNYRGDRFRISAHKLKVAVVTTVLATAIAATGVGIGITKVVDTVKDEIAISSALEEYDSIVNDNTHRTKKNDGFWHDATDIAIEILNAEDRDLAIYAVYNDINYNRTKNMTEIFSEIDRVIANNPDLYSNIPTYGGYEKYLINMGCVDKEGKISVEKYQDKMDAYAVAVANLNKAESNIGGPRK